MKDYTPSLGYGNLEILHRRAKSSKMSMDEYVSFCIDRTLRTPMDDLKDELQQFKERVK